MIASALAGRVLAVSRGRGGELGPVSRSHTPGAVVGGCFRDRRADFRGRCRWCCCFQIVRAVWAEAVPRPQPPSIRGEAKSPSTTQWVRATSASTSIHIGIDAYQPVMGRVDEPGGISGPNVWLDDAPPPWGGSGTFPSAPTTTKPLPRHPYMYRCRHWSRVQ